MAIGRNDPCPCGSGKKFKTCCLPLGRKYALSKDDEAPADPATLFHEMRASFLAIGDGAELAELRAAAGTVSYYTLSSEGEEGPEFASLARAADIVEEVLESNGVGTEEMISIFFPRLPFDVVVGPGGETAADHFLRRYGPGLPPVAVEAVKALVEAEDTVCRVVREKGARLVEDLRTGLRLPTTDDVGAETPCLISRLARYRGLHIPVVLEPVDAADADWLLEQQDEAADAAAALLLEDDIRLRSRYKGVALGDEILMPDSDSEEEEADPTGRT